MQTPTQNVPELKPCAILNSNKAVNHPNLPLFGSGCFCSKLRVETIHECSPRSVIVTDTLRTDSYVMLKIQHMFELGNVHHIFLEIFYNIM